MVQFDGVEKYGFSALFYYSAITPDLEILNAFLFLILDIKWKCFKCNF